MNLSIRGIFLLAVIFLQNVGYALEQISDQIQVVPVVNQTVTQDVVSKHGLSAIFKMRLHRWQDGTPITVFVLNDENPLHARFCKEILNVFPHQMRRIWNRLVFSGTGQAPIELESSEEMIDKLKSTPGAIGYLPANQVQRGVKVLHLQAGGKY